MNAFPLKTLHLNCNISAAPPSNLAFTVNFADGQCYMQSVAARGDAVGRGTALGGGLESLWSWSWLRLQRKWVPGLSSGGKGDRCVRPKNNTTFMCHLISGSLNLLAPTGPVKSCRGFSLPLCATYLCSLSFCVFKYVLYVIYVYIVPLFLSSLLDKLVDMSHCFWVACWIGW
jgi:hypothetical protein